MCLGGQSGDDQLGEDDALNSLLSDDDQDLGEMDGCDEVHLSYVSPTRKHKKSKPPDLTSVKPRVKVRRRRKQ